MCVKAPDYPKDMLERAKLQFEGFDYATQPQKPHWESVQPVFAFPYNNTIVTSKTGDQTWLCLTQLIIVDSKLHESRPIYHRQSTDIPPTING